MCVSSAASLIEVHEPDDVHAHLFERARRTGHDARDRAARAGSARALRSASRPAGRRARARRRAAARGVEVAGHGVDRAAIPRVQADGFVGRVEDHAAHAAAGSARRTPARRTSRRSRRRGRPCRSCQRRDHRRQILGGGRRGEQVRGVHPVAVRVLPAVVERVGAAGGRLLEGFAAGRPGEVLQRRAVQRRRFARAAVVDREHVPVPEQRPVHRAVAAPAAAGFVGHRFDRRVARTALDRHDRARGLPAARPPRPGTSGRRSRCPGPPARCSRAVRRGVPQ